MSAPEPLEPHLLDAFANELAYQTQIVQWSFEAMKQASAARSIAVAQLHQAVAGQPYPLPSPLAEGVRPIVLTAIKESVRALMALQSMLASCGIISWMFWPSKAPRKEPRAQFEARLLRGEKLRALFELKEDSPLHTPPKQSADVRGGFLHLDEMIDEYMGKHPGQSFATFAIGSLKAAEGWDPNGVVRFIDDATWVAEVNGRRIDLARIHDEVLRIGTRVRASVNVIVAQIPRSMDGGSGTFLVSGGRSP